MLFLFLFIDVKWVWSENDIKTTVTTIVMK